MKVTSDHWKPRPSRRLAATTVVLLATVVSAGHANAVDRRSPGADLAPGRVGAGPVNVMVVDPAHPATLYANTYCAGVLKSIDAGGTWGATGLLAGFVLTLAIEPRPPSTVYAGITGGRGLFKSSDAGATWSAVNADPTLPIHEVQALAIDPATPSTVYAGTDAGVLKSRDHGGTWQRLIDFSIGSDLWPVPALAIDPMTPSTLYAAGSFGQVFKSTDSGATWDYASLAGSPAGVQALAIDPATPSTLYAVARGPSVGMFKSTDSGRTWAQVNSNASIVALAIDPAMPSTLYVAAEGNVGAPGGVFKSTDRGATWEPAGGGLPDPASVGALVLDPTTPATLYAATLATAYRGAVFKSTDAAATWHPTGLVAEPICGDGIATCGEECDDGNTVNGDGCDVNCTRPRCGNGILDPGEECDDGNAVSCDGCSADCRIETGSCGDGVLDSNCEQCDDGNRIDGDGCEGNCTLPRCGNGILDPGEECDDGNTNAADGCTSACTVCGNGVVTPPEACDDGNLVNGDGCDADCLEPGGLCGNSRIDAGEECDDGGICVGGPNASDFCTADSACPGGACKTFGGDGCAANCTTESDVVVSFVPGVVQQGNEIAPGTSGDVIHGDPFVIPLPLSGTQTLTIGKERNGQIPVVVKAAAVHLARVSVGNDIVCFCPRAVAAKTCGGTIVEADGVTRSPDCTPGFTAGDDVCQGKNPCTFVHGPGNSAAGVIGCDGLDDVNVSLTQESGGASGTAGPPLLTLSGSGGAGSAVLFATTAIGGGLRAASAARITHIGGGGFGGLVRCTGEDPSIYGPDGELCTDDDPQSQRGTPITAAETTGTVTGSLLNADQVDGDDIGPFSARGAPFRCAALQRGDASGAALASTFTALNRVPWGDVVLASAVVASGSAAPCVGDCDNSGDVAVNEIVTLVNVALGDTQPSACSLDPSAADVTVALVVRAVNNALNGCPLPPLPTPTLTPSITATRTTGYDWPPVHESLPHAGRDGNASTRHGHDHTGSSAASSPRNAASASA